MTLNKRLHISPLNSELLNVVLPGPLREKASNISFHSIETFPEKSYGYIDLPEAEADKLKRKLNDSTLRGVKMRVGEARPKRDLKEEGGQEDVVLDAKAPNQKKRKAKEQGVIPGHELQDRKVQRGWTEPSDKPKPSKRHNHKGDKPSKSKASSLTGKAECLFKADLPPNAATSGDPKVGKIKKRKRGELGRDVIVHEFSNTTKHASFLRDESGAGGNEAASEFVDGKGWVDEDGNIVETGPKRRRSKAEPTEETKLEAKKEAQSRSRRSSRLEVPSVSVTQIRTRRAPMTVADDETSSSGTSSSEAESEPHSIESSSSAQRIPSASRSKMGKIASKGGLGHGKVEVERIERLSITRSSATPPATQEPAPTSTPGTKEVHPLEALFKRPKTAASLTPKKPNLEVTTSFSFFDPDVEEGGSQGLLMPQTPFTQQDIRQRRQRSAAPTPDTAAPGKTFGDLWEGTSDISGGDDDMEGPSISETKDKSATPDVKDEKPESDFSKWFWENRGENNRAWKRRRREAAKEKRQKDNGSVRR